jgi:hypothetical protein
MGGVAGKKVAFLLALVILSLVGATPALADMSMQCTNDMSTVESLQMCVQHAYEQGHIDNEGVAQSLFAKLDAAQAAVDRGQPLVAINILQGFVQEVEAQAGKHIQADHAMHMVQHAEMVIEALAGQ